jgi:hypothetical protein
MEPKINSMGRSGPRVTVNRGARARWTSERRTRPFSTFPDNGAENETLFCDNGGDGGGGRVSIPRGKLSRVRSKVKRGLRSGGGHRTGRGGGAPEALVSGRSAFRAETRLNG